jgi:HlyD family secretion protein
MLPATAPSRSTKLTRKPRVRKAHPGRVSAALAVSLAVNAVLVAAGVYVAVARPGMPSKSPPAAGPDAPPAGSIEALGRVQPAGGVVNVFGVPGDRVVEVLKPLGATVEKGEQLLTLSGAAEREQALKVLDAQIAEAGKVAVAAAKSRAAQVADLEAETKSAEAKFAADTAALDAKLAGLKSQADRATGELQRLKDVRAAGAPVADQDFVKAQALAEGARAEYEAGTVQREKAGEQHAAAQAVAVAKRQTIDAEADRLTAQIPLASLKASRESAAQKVADAVVRAPVAGRVVKIGVRPGDTLATLPAVQLAPAGPMTVVAEVYETDVAKLRGWLADAKSVPVQIDARVVDARSAAKPLTGAVTAAGVAPMIARNAVYALGPREDADRRVVEVEVTLDADSSRLAADYIGLQVRASFLPPAAALQ